jgi:hypothetical protein
LHARTHARTSPQALKRKLSAARDDFVKEVEVCCDLRHEHLVRTRRCLGGGGRLAAFALPGRREIARPSSCCRPGHRCAAWATRRRRRWGCSWCGGRCVLSGGPF